MAINVYCKDCDFSVQIHSPSIVSNIKEIHTGETGHINYGEIEIFE